jgi:hypothetical protein
VRVVHQKTREENWIPLFDDPGAALYPELMGELDAVRRDRIGGLMLCRDWGDRGPWPTVKCDLTLMRHKVKAVVRAAGLRDELSFTSFRHGGFTEAADADLTDAEIRAQGATSRRRGHFARVGARRHVPGAAARFHRVVDRGPPLTLDGVAVGVGLADDDKLLINQIGDRGGDRR